MIQGLHHIAVAVPSLQEALPRWVDGLGLRLLGTEEVATEGVRVAILMAGSTRIELMEPTAPDSPVAKFLAKRGPGLHHLAFQVGDTGATMKVLAAHGAPLLSEAPKPGAHDTLVAFCHPKWFSGVLAEFVQETR